VCLGRENYTIHSFLVKGRPDLNYYFFFYGRAMREKVILIAFTIPFWI